MAEFLTCIELGIRDARVVHLCEQGRNLCNGERWEPTSGTEKQYAFCEACRIATQKPMQPQPAGV